MSPSQQRRRLFDLGLTLGCFNGTGFVFLHRIYFTTGDLYYLLAYSPKEAAYPFSQTAYPTVKFLVACLASNIFVDCCPADECKTHVEY